MTTTKTIPTDAIDLKDGDRFTLDGTEFEALGPAEERGDHAYVPVRTYGAGSDTTLVLPAEMVMQVATPRGGVSVGEQEAASWLRYERIYRVETTRGVQWIDAVDEHDAAASVPGPVVSVRRARPADAAECAASDR